RTPSDYLPEAVLAAERILQERGISKEEIIDEEWKIAQIEMSDAIRKSSRSDYAAWMRELFGGERLTSASERWFGVVLLLYSLCYLFNVFVTFRRIAWLYRCPDCPHTGAIVVPDLGFALYSTVCLYCILKQFWLGWS